MAVDSGDRCQNVLDIEVAHQGRLGANRSRGGLDIHAQTAGVRFHAARSYVCIFRSPVGNRFRLAELREVSSGVVIGVRDRVCGRLGPGTLEQASLGGPVCRHVAVKVEMFGRQVCKYRGVEFYAPDPLEGQSVRGRFHRGVTAADLSQARQEPHHVQGFRRRVDRFLGLVAHAMRDGSQQGSRLPRRLQQRVDQVDSRGLTVGTSDPRYAQVTVGPLVEPKGRLSQGPPAVADASPATAHLRRSLALANDGRGPGRKSLRDEGVPVDPLSRKREEGLPRAHLSRVVLQARDFQRRNRSYGAAF